MDSKVGLYLLFVGFMFVGSFGPIILYYNTSVDVLEEQAFHYLNAIASSRADHIEYYLNQKKEAIRVLAKDHHFPDLLLGVAEGKPTFGEFNMEHYQYVFETSRQKEYNELSILDDRGTVLVSSNNNIIGDDEFNEDYFLNAREDSYVKDVYYSKDNEGNMIAVSAPLEHPDSGKFLGVFVTRMNTDLLNEITLDRTGLGETGEVYLVNRDGYMLTQSRFDDVVVLENKISDSVLNACFSGSGEEGSVLVYENQRGARVIGSGVHLLEMDWCVLAEIKEREAVGLLRDELIKSGMLVLIGVLFLMVVFILIANRFLLGIGKKRI